MTDILPELNNKDYISSVLEDYDVHFCRDNEVNELVDFIDKYWKKNHILVLSRKLLDWQHYDQKNRRYNFVIAKHRNSGEIHSIMGFIPTSHFDPEIRNVEMWICIWKAREDIHRKGLGASLHYYLKTQFDIEAILLFGMSEISLNITNRWGFKTGKTEHYYLPNMHHKEVLTQNRHDKKDVGKNQPGWILKELTLAEYEQLDTQKGPFEALDRYKSKNFFVNRYYNHPIYKYCFLGIQHNARVEGIAVTRQCGNETSTCLRIVDFIGDLACLCYVKGDLQALMIQKDYEYIDFVVAGFASEEIKRTGFINRKEDPETVIPNYFEPLLEKNVDLLWAYKTVNEDYPFSIFKGDADQDRPNIL